MTDRVDGSSTKHAQRQHLEPGTKGSSVRHLLRIRNRLPGKRGRQSRTILHLLGLPQVAGLGNIYGILTVSVPFMAVAID